MFKVNEAFQGFFSAPDLLRSEFTIHFELDAICVKNDIVLFELHNHIFSLSLRLDNKDLILNRNEKSAIINLSNYLQEPLPLRIFVIVSPIKLALFFKIEKEIVLKNEVVTSPIYPDISLLQEAIKNNLLPITTYESEEQFREKIHHSFLQLNKKIEESNSHKSYWDIGYNGGKIESKKPKREPDIQPLVHQALADIMLLGNITISPEVQTGVGDVDFIFTAQVENAGLKKICVELKLAHSNDLFHGYLEQLPKYMNATSSKYGLYCVLNFKGKGFDKPSFKNKKDLDFNLNLQASNINYVNPDNVRFIVINLLKPVTASAK